MVCDKDVCERWWLTKRRGGGGAGGGGGGGAGGIQNQKQEPHTKVWGKRCKKDLLLSPVGVQKVLDREIV